MLLFKWGKEILTKEQQESIPSFNKRSPGNPEDRLQKSRKIDRLKYSPKGELSTWTCGDSDLRYKLNVNQKNEGAQEQGYIHVKMQTHLGRWRSTFPSGRH